MRIPFPIYIPLPLAFTFATVLVSLQQLQGTDVVFSVYSFLFIILAVITFNVAKGFTRSTGGYVFFYAFGVIVGLVGKAYLREAADSNLLVPNLTMKVFTGGMAAMLAAVFVAGKLTRKKPFLVNVVKPKDMQNATIGCIVTGLLIQGFVLITPNQSGTFLSALNQVNRFLPLGIILGTLHQIRKSNGKKCINWIVFTAMAVMFIFSGLFHFSKEGMFLPIICWLFAVASLRYRFRLYQVFLGAAAAFFMIHYLVPYAQYGRDVRGVNDIPSDSERVTIAIDLLSNLGQLRENYNEDELAHEGGPMAYFNNPEGLLDRLEIISPDDALINETELRGPFGLAPVPLLFLNLIPHVLYPGKPLLAYGNLYAHEIGDIISDDDFTTGISFSPTGDGYHMAKWVGVLIVAPILWIMLFTLFDSMCGDVRQAPWGLLVIAVYSHSAPEGMLGSVIYMMGYTAFGIVFAAYTCAQVMPIIGTLLFGPEQTRAHRGARLQKVPARLSAS